ncbi:MAG: hypothetical protein JWO03_1086 [Bacteroidetes bacterium]|nr:hypothetical protein [Bacteroidota bacterium]
MLKKIFAPHPTIYKYDRAWIGIVLGLIVPLSGVLIVYLISVGNHYMAEGHPDLIPFGRMLQSLKIVTVLFRYMSVGCMLNLGVFFLFINRDYYNVSRGIIFSTILIAIPIMITIITSWFK